ncbi:TolC family protein [Aliikangiella sp. IMCC44653]
MKKAHFLLLICLLTLSKNVFSMQLTEPLTLSRAIQLALDNDPWLVKSLHLEKALVADSVAANTLPDPKVSVGLANIPTDNFAFNQEGMTQFKLGVSQMFPQGDSLALKSKQYSLLSEQQPYQRENRKAMLTMQVTQLWLDAYKAQLSITLIEENRALFEQLADVAQASYSSAVGKTRQQDIIRAQLELTRLDDKLTKLSQQEMVTRQQLMEWLGNQYSSAYMSASNQQGFAQLNDIEFATKLPSVSPLYPTSFLKSSTIHANSLAKMVEAHPLIKAVDTKVAASKVSIDLAKQKYKPSWGINASYGYRENMPSGQVRTDLFSLGVTFDLPLFTANRQDKQVSSAIYTTESIKTEKWILLRNFLAKIEALKVQLLKLNERQSLYNERLLPQMSEQAEASLTAYTNDDGDFAEVVRSRIAQLNAEIDALDISVERLKTISQLNYYFYSSEQQQASASLGE